jgi:hypothetical protein
MVSTRVTVDRVQNTLYTRKSLHRYAASQGSADSSDRGELDAYEKHRVGDLVFTHSTSEDHHPGFSGGTRELVQITDILYNVDDEARRPERVEI